jgi:hypothetical protein
MQRTDKLLIGIVAGIVLVVVAAFAILLLRPAPAYAADDTPEHIVHNYLLALQQQDYERAYGYLLPSLPGYPRSVTEFRDHVTGSPWEFEQDTQFSTFEIEPPFASDDRAVVTVHRRVFYERGLFGSGNYETSFNVGLQRPAPDLPWKIESADQFWHACWSQSPGC